MHCSGGHLLPCTEWHRLTCAVSRPWSHWCRGGGIPTQWRVEGGGWRLSPREGGHPNSTDRSHPGPLDSQLPACHLFCSQRNPLASWLINLTQLGRRLPATQIGFFRGQGTPGLEKGNDVLWAQKRQALGRPVAAAAKVEAISKALRKLFNVY